VSTREETIRELARVALTEGRVDYVIGWKVGYNTSEMIPAFVKDAADVDQLVWNPLAHHNLTTFLKRKMPDPPNAKIGVCVKGCDSRTLVALLQEELVDKDRLYVIGVPCQISIVPTTSASGRNTRTVARESAVGLVSHQRKTSGDHGEAVRGMRQQCYSLS